MYRTLLLALLSLASVLSAAEKKPNVLVICVDDLRPELPSFGKDYIHAPAMEKLIAEGRLFKRHYVQAPTCGASRFSLLTGLYPKSGAQLSNNAIVNHFKKENAAPSLPQWFRDHGYTTMAIGKVSHYPGGHCGQDWNEEDKLEIPGAWDIQPRDAGLWKTPQGLMHGLADGQGRVRGKTPAIEAKDASYPDDQIMDLYRKNIPKLTEGEKPWLCMVGFLRPHLPFGCPKEFYDLYQDKKLPPIPAAQKPPKGDYWNGSGEFFNGYSHDGRNPNKDEQYATDVRKHYAACVSYTDSKVAQILDLLEKSGQADNTIIVLWGDHGWHLGEQQIWGKHTPYAVALHSPLIIKAPGMQAAGKPTESLAETIDIYPTLCQLAGLTPPKHLDGASLVPQLENPAQPSEQTAISYWGGLKSVIKPSEHQIIDRKTNKVKQRYDLSKDPHEANNLERE
ncbi:iduronate 2-sulfatase [Rubritalea squalenifaciens DSM 18772]|uniref:Iduronate 2-sulfatase n=1 Tax=Rubritalea squalenifaciens DSM 18772 TaxID=1123071 RepID=A0A1M6BID6_9BACT|nr:sulfatase [Rubritalea squalenifaciens]SHI48348.1 iduronate 2-sulfatase [Rubritalea squalenifaciens DSM 18772]